MVQSKTVERWLVPFLLISAALAVTFWLGWQLGQGVTQGINALISGAISLVLAYVIFQRPYLGLGILLATLPIGDVLPKLPYVTSLSPVIGAVTVLAYFRQRYRSGLPLLPARWHIPYIFGALFVLWLFVSNPHAALKAGRGIALYTYLQLWVLVGLAGELLWNREYHRRIIWLYVAACLISAFVALQEGGAIGDTFSARGGEGGLGGISSSARQFSVAIVLLVYLRSGLKPHHWLTTATWLGQILLLVGVAETGSRTGILIVAVSVVLMLLSPTSGIRPQRVIVPSIVIFAIYFSVPDTYWDSLWNSIFPTIQSGTDTLAIRYELWETATRMVIANPFSGVGINQFIPNVALYSDPLSSTVRITGAHSVYFSVLAETGVVGFALFMGLVISSLLLALRAALKLQDKADVNLAYTWFVVLALLLIGGITKQDQYDKLLWFVFGACASLSHFLKRESAQANDENAPVQQQFQPIEAIVRVSSRGQVGK